jgi:hypothetical protein
MEVVRAGGVRHNDVCVCNCVGYAGFMYVYVINLCGCDVKMHARVS